MRQKKQKNTSLIWTYSQVGRKCCFHNNAPRYTPGVRVVPPAYGAGDDELHGSQLKQERERKIERLGKRQALYTRLYFPRGVRSRKWPSCAAICGVRDTAYFRRCASSSLDLFFYGPMWRRGLPLSEPFDPTFSFSCFIVVN